MSKANIHTSIPKELYEEVKSFSDQSGINMNKIIEMALTEWLENNKEKILNVLK